MEDDYFSKKYLKAVVKGYNCYTTKWPFTPYDPAIHVSSYKKHLQICAFLLQRNTKQHVSNLEYAFLTPAGWKKAFPVEQKECEFKAKAANQLQCWSEYVKILDCYKGENVSSQLIDNITQKLSKSAFKSVVYQFDSINGGNRARVDVVKIAADGRDKFAGIERLFTRRWDISSSSENICFKNGNDIIEYQYNDKPFEKLSLLEKVATLVSISLGSAYSSVTSLEDSPDSRVSHVCNKGMDGVLRSLASKYRPSIYALREDQQEQYVYLSDLFDYYKNPANSEKVLFDLSLGLFCYNFDLHSFISHSLNGVKQKKDVVIKSLYTNIVADISEIRLIEAIDDFYNHISSTKDTPALDLQDKYCLYGTRYLSGEVISDLRWQDYYLYLWLRNSRIIRSTESLSKRGRSLAASSDDILDLTLRDIVSYFGRKENPRKRKQQLYMSVENVEDLIVYRNRIARYPFDSSLIKPIALTREELKKRIFSHFFIF